MQTVQYTVQRVPVERTLALRKAVLRPHLSDSEPYTLEDDDLPTTVAFGALTPEDQVIGVARLSSEPPPFAEHQRPSWRLRGMATDPEVRNRGIGAALLKTVTGYVAGAGGGILWANARLAAKHLYERAGMQPWGVVWEEPDIGPHVVMWLDVPTARA
ncbi:MAG TPA: GNAT family N-acetyltransferase [Solirubrobacteraceae bacterium]|jgi:hypothetical protein|nr:GNAT family N-acetyltransferase [Solirubrobacteraceae bacterium]